MNQDWNSLFFAEGVHRLHALIHRMVVLIDRRQFQAAKSILQKTLPHLVQIRWFQRIEGRKADELLWMHCDIVSNAIIRHH